VATWQCGNVATSLKKLKIGANDMPSVFSNMRNWPYFVVGVVVDVVVVVVGGGGGGVAAAATDVDEYVVVVFNIVVVSYDDVADEDLCSSCC